MSNVLIEEGTMTAIADAIRGKTGKADTMLPSAMPAEIEGISGGNKNAIEFWNNITSIGSHAFEDCTSLDLTELPAGITSIGESAFSGCTSLALTELPAGITSIDKFAFQLCTSLISITFKGKPNTIVQSAFVQCVNLTIINVPWAEGEVEGAPWGASYATIKYNYTG